MSIGLTIDVRSAEVDAKIQLLMARLTTRTEIHESIAERARELTRPALAVSGPAVDRNFQDDVSPASS